MTLTPILLTSLLCFATAAQYGSPVVWACNPHAIGPAQRPRYQDLLKQLLAAMREQKELPDGYAFRLDEKAISLQEVAEWASMERLCCPFFVLQLAATGSSPDWWLSLTGPVGVKPFIQAEFALQNHK